MKWVIATVLALGSAGLYALDTFAAWLMEHNAAARGFVEAPFFTACAVLGASVVCAITFASLLLVLGIIPFRRPAGRTASEVAE